LKFNSVSGLPAPQLLKRTYSRRLPDGTALLGNGIAFADVLASVHRLLPVEREAFHAWVTNLSFDRERHGTTVIRRGVRGVVLA